MIVDTSALVAIVLVESGWQELLDAVASSNCTIPAPVLTELQLTTGKRQPRIAESAATLIERLMVAGATVAPFGHHHTSLTSEARVRFGKGNGSGGKLNFGDLMVYAIAKDRGEPLLCTGRDFASTDLAIHPASRLDP